MSDVAVVAVDAPVAAAERDEERYDDVVDVDDDALPCCR